MKLLKNNVNLLHMYLMYVDESGDTVPLSQKGSKYLVLTGCITNESDIYDIEIKFRKIKEDFFQKPDIEIKSNFLRYANPDLKESSPLKLNSKEKYDELEDSITKFLVKIPVVLYSVVIDKKSYWEQYPAQNPYDVAYIFLIERFQKFLVSKSSLGIVIIDPREGQVEKTFIGEELDRIHNKLRWTEGDFWNKCPNIVERLLFSTSDKTVGIQLSDLFCYPIYSVFEYNKKPEEYWRYKEITSKKLFEDGKVVDGVGLKFFPDKTKKGLRFYS